MRPARGQHRRANRAAAWAGATAARRRCARLTTLRARVIRCSRCPTRVRPAASAGGLLSAGRLRPIHCLQHRRSHAIRCVAHRQRPAVASCACVCSDCPHRRCLEVCIATSALHDLLSLRALSASAAQWRRAGASSGANRTGPALSEDGRAGVKPRQHVGAVWSVTVDRQPHLALMVRQHLARHCGSVRLLNNRATMRPRSSRLSLRAIFRRARP